MSVLWHALKLFLITSFVLSTNFSCKMFKSKSATKAIVSEGNQNAFGFLPVLNFLPNPKADSSLNAGQQYADDLINKMTFYAMVECLPANGLNAAEWYKEIEGRAFADQLYVNANRDLVFPVDNPAFPAGSAPCRIVNNNLLRYPVIEEAINLPFRTPTLTENMYHLAQAYYLSIRGSYRPGDTGKTAGKLALLPLLGMFQAHTGLISVNGNQFIEDFLALDADYNPCVIDSSELSKAKLKGSAPQWRIKAFDCVDVPGEPGTKNYLPKQNYATLRDNVGHEIDALHDRLYPNGGLKMTDLNTRDLLFDELTNLKYKPSAQQISAMYERNYGEEYEDESSVQMGLTAYQNPKLTRRPQRPNLRPTTAAEAVAAAQASLNNISVSPSKPPKNIIPANPNKPYELLFKKLNAQTIANTTTTTNASSSGLPNISKPSNTSIKNPLTPGLKTNEYLDQTDFNTLNGVATAGKMGGTPPKMSKINFPANSQFTGYEITEDGSTHGPKGTKVVLNKTSGEPFVYKPVKVNGIEGTVTEVANFPHAGTKAADGVMGKDFVGSYIRKDKETEEQKLGLHVGDGSHEKNHELDTVKAANGGFYVKCNDKNREVYKELSTKSKELAQSDPKKSAAIDKFISTAKAHNQCGGKLRLAGLALCEEEPENPQKAESQSTEDPSKVDTAAEPNSSTDGTDSGDSVSSEANPPADLPDNTSESVSSEDVVQEVNTIDTQMDTADMNFDNNTGAMMAATNDVAMNYPEDLPQDNFNPPADLPQDSFDPGAMGGSDSGGMDSGSMDSGFDE